MWGSGTYYGDGSGGDLSRYPRARRCGLAIATMTPGCELKYGVHSPLPGDIQTVPRAEINAFLLLCELAVPGASILFVTDHQALKTTFEMGPEHSTKTLNGELYHKAFKYIQQKNLIMSIKWMPSHLNDPDRPPREIPLHVTPGDIIGNSLADELANKGALNAKLPLEISQHIVYYTGLVEKYKVGGQ